MRRSFGPNKLYSKVFFEHLRKLFQRGYSIEFFPEGGRTRTGRLLPPSKAGNNLYDYQIFSRYG